MTMRTQHEIAFRLDPVLWAKSVLGITPHIWQEPFLRAKRGADILGLTSRQFGKTTAAALCLAHTAIFEDGTLSVVACPSQQQSVEAIRKVRAMVSKAGGKLVVDNVYRIELENGSRVLALPATDDTVRGLTVTGWIIADEAARLPADLIAALRPMRARCRNARFVMISTAWSRTDQFWLNWSSDDQSWLRIKATIEDYPDVIAADFLDKERRQGDDYFKREYLGIPSGGHVSPFTLELYQRATQPLALPQTFGLLKPSIITHDVGRSKDRSTAVVGGRSPLAPNLVFASDFAELPQGLYGSARANELAAVDRRLGGNNLIVADLSNDATYGEILYERIGRRLIGLQITRSGAGMDRQTWRAKNGCFPVYTTGRTHLIDLLHRTMSDDELRILHGPVAMRAYEQLMMLEIDLRETGLVYKCPTGQHDDLAISLAMMVWAAVHPHLSVWMRELEFRPPRAKRPTFTSLGWT
jgi:Terminase large subunit, T4likevirus-type, N-terminal